MSLKRLAFTFAVLSAGTSSEEAFAEQGAANPKSGNPQAEKKKASGSRADEVDRNMSGKMKAVIGTGSGRPGESGDLALRRRSLSLP